MYAQTPTSPYTPNLQPSSLFPTAGHSASEQSKCEEPALSFSPTLGLIEQREYPFTSYTRNLKITQSLALCSFKLKLSFPHFKKA